MFKKIKLSLSSFFVKGLLRNSFYGYLRGRLKQRSREFFLLLFLIVLSNVAIWFIWIDRIINSGFAVESHFNVVLNLPLIPHFYSLLFLNSFISAINIILSLIIYKKSSFISMIFLFLTLLLNISILAVTIFYIINFKL